MSDFPHLKRSSLKIDFDASGPRIGSIQLLENTTGRFCPAPIETLEQKLAKAFAAAFDCSPWKAGLDVICRAMNDGDLARAAFATVYLPRLRPSDLREDMMKASPEDPDHPGWPKGSPDGKGGEFSPKESGGDNLTFESKDQRINRLKSRQQLRSIIKKILTTKRVLRLLAEVSGDAVPGNIAADVLTIADLASMAREINVEIKLSNAAIAFAEKGPQDLEALLVAQDNVAFPSFRALIKLDLLQTDLEKRYGAAGDGYQYHHIVEQGPNDARFTSEQLQSTSNVVMLPTIVHEEVSAIYGKSYYFLTGTMPLRDYLRSKSFEQQRAWGLWALQQAGALK